MVRRAKRAAHPVFRVEAGLPERFHRGRFQRFVFAQVGQDAGQAVGQHGLAGAGRAGHQHAVAASRGDFQRALGERLADHVAHVGRGRRRRAARRGQQRQFLAAVQRGADLQQRFRALHFHALHHRGLLRAFGRQDQFFSGAAQRQRGDQRAANVAQCAAQREFAEEHIVGDVVGAHLPACGEQADGDGQIKPPALFRQVGRREVDDDALARKFKVGIENRAAHAVAAFFDRGLGQPDYGKARQARRQMRLYCDFRRIHAGFRAAVNDCK